MMEADKTFSTKKEAKMDKENARRNVYQCVTLIFPLFT